MPYAACHSSVFPDAGSTTGSGRGITLSAADWLGRYPELEPELGVMLGEMIGAGRTQVWLLTAWKPGVSRNDPVKRRESKVQLAPRFSLP